MLVGHCHSHQQLSAYLLSDKTPGCPVTVNQLPSAIHQYGVPRVLRRMIDEIHSWLVIGTLSIASQRLTVQPGIATTHQPIHSLVIINYLYLYNSIHFFLVCTDYCRLVVVCAIVHKSVYPAWAIVSAATLAFCPAHIIDNC